MSNYWHIHVYYFNHILLLIYLFSVCLHNHVYKWKSEDNFGELVLFFHHVCSRV